MSTTTRSGAQVAEWSRSKSPLVRGGGTLRARLLELVVELAVVELVRVGVQLPPVPPDLVALYLHHRRLGLLVVLELVARLRGV